MKLGSVAIAFNERRFISSHLNHIPSDLDKLVLVSENPWYGHLEEDDGTDKIAKEYADIMKYDWASEADQRNVGQVYFKGYDWIITLDPDEFLDDEGWQNLIEFLRNTSAEAVTCSGMHTYWKDGYVAEPPETHKGVIAVRPSVEFTDKRAVNAPTQQAPVWVHHFSWARTDEEVWSKISHYAHAGDFDLEYWFENVWKKWSPGDKNVHPVNPESLHDFVKASLPEEIERLGLWPPRL